MTGATHEDRQIGPDDLVYFVCATCGRLATAFRGHTYDPDAPRIPNRPLLVNVVPREGFEPPTLCLEGRCSIH